LKPINLATLNIKGEDIIKCITIEDSNVLFFL
jgi:hypothetical protein